MADMGDAAAKFIPAAQVPTEQREFRIHTWNPGIGSGVMASMDPNTGVVVVDWDRVRAAASEPGSPMAKIMLAIYDGTAITAAPKAGVS